MTGRQVPLLLLAVAAAGCGGAGRMAPAPAAAPALPGPCTLQEAEAPAVDPLLDLADQLRALPGVATVEEREALVTGTRFFVLGFDQPVDHCDPAGPRFTQQVTLLYRGAAAPTVLYTSGYDIGTTQGQVRMTRLLTANQVALEHRFFEDSVPVTLDWSKLDLFQAATDQHRVTRSLRALLTGRWLGTGASKGGMTAVYHRAFYPDDVTATVADVAPISSSRSDPRFASYLDRIGPPACRTAMKAFQHALLAARREAEPLMASSAAAAGDGYTLLGADAPSALGRAFEIAVLEVHFAMWQYLDESWCARIPPPAATTAERFAFMDAVYGGAERWVGDRGLRFYAPYYYQSATQLGGPAYPEAHLLDLAGPAGLGDVPEIYPPLGVTKTWDARAMADVDAWVRAHGDRLMFVYGERDPWSGGQFTPGPGRDAVKYVAPLANHGASILLLSAPDQADAEGRLSRWMGVPVAIPRVRSAPGSARQAAPLPEDDLLLRRPRL